MTKLCVLISGAGIAGPVAAYFLRRLKTPMSITVIERASSLRALGQNIDIRGPAIDIVRDMGIIEAIRAKNTTEEGFLFVDTNGQKIAEFPVTESSGSFTSEFEILRGDFAQIVYDASMKKDDDTNEQTELHYTFGDSIESIAQEKLTSSLSSPGLGGNEKVSVRLSSGKEMTCDLVILADGLFSATRPMVFGKEQRPGKHVTGGAEDKGSLLEPIQSLGQYSGLFTMSQIPGVTDQDHFARWYNATRGRLIMVRPDPYGTTRIFLGVTRSDLDEFHELSAHRKDINSAKALFRREFEDSGWISAQILEGLDASEDFYFQLTAQVKAKELVNGRVALLGDSGYCPSPISGKGTAIAIMGAYSLFECLSEITSTADIPRALNKYEAKIAPLAKEAQKLIPGAPWIANPQTQVGIKILNSVLWGVASTSWAKRAVESFFEGKFPKWNPSSNEDAANDSGN